MNQQMNVAVLVTNKIDTPKITFSFRSICIFEHLFSFVSTQSNESQILDIERLSTQINPSQSAKLLIVSNFQK